MARNKKTMHTKDLVEKIEKIARQRIAKEKVVSLEEYYGARSTEDPYSILLIEDDETMRGALKRLFEGEGYRVIPAADGTQLSQVLDNSMVDLIILDIGLPWINGFELAELMKSHHELKSIPLIFISGRTSQADIKRAFSVGADDFLKKPFEIEKIKKTVKTLLNLAHE